jgi:hypothetical protein
MTRVMRFHCPAGDQDEEVVVFNGKLEEGIARVVKAAKDHLLFAHSIDEPAGELRYVIEVIERKDR